MNNKRAINAYLKNKLSKQEQRQNHGYGEYFDGCQMGGDCWGMAEEMRGLRSTNRALAGVAQWIKCQPENQRVTGSIPSLEHVPELWTRSPVGSAREATTL